jgi:hypothetical protein
MQAATELRDLKLRHQWMVRSFFAVSGLAALTLLAALAHFETGAGAEFNDVHLPADWLRERRFGTFQFGEPYPVGVGGVAKVVQWIVFIAFAGGQLAALVWLARALWKKRGKAVSSALLAVFALHAFVPVPKVVSPGIPEAVSVKTAQGLLNDYRIHERSTLQLVQRIDDEATAYVRAQIAYVQGNRQQARALASNIDTVDLSSPIEAPYRMQFLRGRPEGRSTVCFIRFGCLSESEAARRFLWLAWVAVAATLTACGLGLTCILIGERLARAGSLAAQGEQVRLSRLAHSMQRSVK